MKCPLKPPLDCAATPRLANESNCSCLHFHLDDPGKRDTSPLLMVDEEVTTLDRIKKHSEEVCYV